MMRAVALGLLVLASGCKVGGAIAATLGDVVGETSDVACDRRTGKKPAPFCQEVIDTVAVSNVKDDCNQKFAASGYEGRCPRASIIAGCKIHKNNDDGSEVWDWYYDVSDAGPDAYQDAPKTKDDIKAMCADPKRYEEGADFDDRP